MDSPLLDRKGIDVKTLTKSEAKRLFKKDVSPGQYEFSQTAYGGLVVEGFTPTGAPIPGKEKELFSYSFFINVVEDHWMEHGNGD